MLPELLMDEVEEPEVDADEPLVFAAVAEPLVVEVPGIVAALTTPKSPTPATAPMAAPVVSRFRVRIAESLARTLASIWPWLFMSRKFGVPR